VLLQRKALRSKAYSQNYKNFQKLDALILSANIPRQNPRNQSHLNGTQKNT
jgi:hypothetical protein